jgi:hypothetical protein
MAYSAADLAAIESAILELAQGKRVVSVTGMDGRTVQWQQADLDKLIALRNQIQSESQAAAGRPRFVLTSTSKGL